MSSIIKVNTIQDTTGNDALTIDSSGNVTASQGFVPSTQLSHRNLIINGAMQVAQRGTSTTSANTAGYHEGPDRMRRSESQLGSATFTREQSTDAPEGFSYSLKETTTTVSAGYASEAYRPLNIRIEGQNLQHLAWGTSAAKSITFSFWVKSSVTGTYSMTFLSYDSSDNTDIITNTYTISSANTWEYKTVTISGNTNANIRNTNESGLDIQWCAGSGSDYTSTDSTSWGDLATEGYHYGQTANVCGTLNATWQITGVQLEVGSVATPFEHRSYGEELARCKRYYEVLGRGGDWTGDRAYNHSSRIVNLPYWAVEKRADPSVTVYSNYGVSGSMSGYSSGTENAVTAVSDPSRYSVGRFITLTNSITQPHIGYFVADSEL